MVNWNEYPLNGSLDDDGPSGAGGLDGEAGLGCHWSSSFYWSLN